MAITVREIKGLTDIKAFIEFGHDLYRGNPYWVPRLVKDELELLQRPYSFIERALFLAEQDGVIVGRVAAIVNRNEQSSLGLDHVRFGWLDFVDDYDASRGLLNAVEVWAAARRMTHVKGPFGYTNLDPAGMLTEGFEEIATIINLYNYPYYPDHMRRLGYESSTQWVEYEGRVPESIPEKVKRFSQIVRERYGLRDAQLSSNKEIVSYAEQFFSLFNESYSHLDGFVPISPEQKQFYIDRFFKLLNPDFISIVLDDQDELVAFGITMPSFSKAMQRAAGKMYPYGWYHIQRAMKKNDRADLYLIGVRPEYRNKGVPALIMHKIFDTFIKYGIKYAETNPEQEANFNVQNLWKDYEVRQHKRREAFVKALQVS